MNQASDYDLITPENGPNITSIVYIQARARSLDNAFAMMSFEIVSGILCTISFCHLASVKQHISFKCYFLP